MINVTLISNDGNGIPQRFSVHEETTLGDFLRNHADDIDLEDYNVRVRANGVSVQAHRDYVLHDGDRISVTAKKIEGASL